MTLKVEVSEEAAAKLQAKASLQNADPGSLASRLLTDALEKDDCEGWEIINQKRVELIRASSRRSLTVEEKVELQSLQEAADRLVEAQDGAMYDHLTEFEKAIDEISPQQ